MNLDWKEFVEIDPRYFRPSEVDFLLGNSQKAQTELGWKPKVDFKSLVKKMVDHDWEMAKRERLLKESGFSSRFISYPKLLLSKLDGNRVGDLHNDSRLERFFLGRHLRSPLLSNILICK